MKSIIPEQSQSTIFDKLIQAAMDIFISEGEVQLLNIGRLHLFSLLRELFREKSTVKLTRPAGGLTFCHITFVTDEIVSKKMHNRG